jgi:cyanidin-3-O-glucoside 2''-O-glucuronosyltransferase
MSKIFDALNFSSNGHLSDNERIEQCIKQSRDIILVKTFRELEGKYLDYLATLLNKKIVPVGPLVQDPYISGDSKAMEIMKWLDKKKQSSTILVSFGSEYYLSKQEREELAYGLELSNVNFIWVLRFPAGEKNKKINLEEELPLGFMERVKNRGFIIENWAPQAMILKHCSIGGFVSHCGWSSIMESMKFGVPIIAIPKQLDQPMNARLVENVGVGLQVKRDEDGNYGREEIAGAIKAVVVTEEEEIGGNIKRKAREMSQCIEKKGEEEIDEVVHELVKLIS